jgi:hypothetical protein
MTKHAPGLRKAASNADLYSDPSPPASRPLRHAYSTLSRAHTTASLPHRSRGLRNWYDDEPRSRHSVAAPYANLIDADEDYGGMVRQEQQSPPPVPPKILEESGAEKPESKVQMEDLKRLRDAERRDAMKGHPRHVRIHGLFLRKLSLRARKKDQRSIPSLSPTS